ncbi:hypothetical protein [Gordonia humi]|uniref:Uncharacterized protein n=1 Tax=Gordonia humi TaxID=686429 RepID=A0A840ESV3_9ACTN|nr:hypothetical protein [Gordonia humi]MBB4133458.1 hypothetical protein [Gordonia humi]
MGDDEALEQVQTRRSGPLTVAVAGRPGAGSSTMAAALRTCFRLCCMTIGDTDPPPTADLLIRVIGAQVREQDRRALADVAVPTIVVAAKADVRSDPRALADAAADDLGRSVHPVSGLLASAAVGPADLVGLRAADPPAPLLRRYGLTGVAAARELLDRLPESTAREVTERLRAVSGIDALADPIRERSGPVATLRDRRLRDDLRLLAARGVARDDAERALVGFAS